MKIIGFTFLFFIFTTQAFGALIRIKAPKIQGEIFAEGVKVTDTQAEISCRFFKEGEPGQLESKVMPWTHHKKQSGQNYSINIKSKTYWEILPGFKIKNCSYKLIVIAKDKNNKSYVGDFILLGSKNEFMTPQEIEDMKNEIQELERRFSPLHLFLEYRRGRMVLSYR